MARQSRQNNNKNLTNLCILRAGDAEHAENTLILGAEGVKTLEHINILGEIVGLRARTDARSS